MISIEAVNTDGVVLLRLIWATTPDRRAGQRRTDLETIESRVALMARLAELATAICWESDEFVEIEGATRAPASERPL